AAAPRTGAPPAPGAVTARAAAGDEPGGPGGPLPGAVAAGAGAGPVRAAAPLPAAGVAAVTAPACEAPCVLFALARESGPFRRAFRPRQRFPGAPCPARLCGAPGQSVLVVET